MTVNRFRDLGLHPFGDVANGLGHLVLGAGHTALGLGDE
jgi:hypothetical protein